MEKDCLGQQHFPVAEGVIFRDVLCLALTIIVVENKICKTRIDLLNGSVLATLAHTLQQTFMLISFIFLLLLVSVWVALMGLQSLYGQLKKYFHKGPGGDLSDLNGRIE